MFDVIFRYGMRYTKYAKTFLVYGPLRKLANGCQPKFGDLIYKHQ
jgi:hypothetical protein